MHDEESLPKHLSLFKINKELLKWSVSDAFILDKLNALIDNVHNLYCNSGECDELFYDFAYEANTENFYDVALQLMLPNETYFNKVITIFHNSYFHNGNLILPIINQYCQRVLVLSEMHSLNAIRVIELPFKNA